MMTLSLAMRATSWIAGDVAFRGRNLQVMVRISRIALNTLSEREAMIIASRDVVFPMKRRVGQDSKSEGTSF